MLDSVVRAGIRGAYFSSACWGQMGELSALFSWKSVLTSGG